MLSEAVLDHHSPDVSSPASNASGSGSASGGPDGARPASPPVPSPQIKTEQQHPPPKTDKPRPHVCAACGRSFARLEHLKRHERSHTKEKPFECPECGRCFARRDLLLRHQQKLHYQTTPSARPRNGRRESVSGATANKTSRVRKNSIANSAVGGTGGTGQVGGRPRANTLGHLDLASLGLADSVTASHNRMSALGVNSAHRMSMSGLSGPGTMDYRGMVSSVGNHSGLQGLPKIDTHALPGDVPGALRTAPPYAGFGGFSLDQLFPPGNTINPAQLHFNDASLSPAAFNSFPQFLGNPQESLATADVEDYSWMRKWDASQLNAEYNEYAIDESSPSHVGSVGFQDSMMEMQNTQAQTTWQHRNSFVQNMMTPAPFQLDALTSGLRNIDGPLDTISPPNLNDYFANTDAYMNMQMQNGQHDGLNDVAPNRPTSLSNFGSDSPSMSSSMTGSARQSSVTSVSTESITDATRQALLISLSQPSVFGHNYRKYSQPSISSPLSPGIAVRNGPTLPSTPDLQRYVNAYIQYFHPHLPFLHIPTLSFDSPDYISNLRSAGAQASFGHAGIIGGGGGLILAMAAIGALYEYDHQASRELFDSAKKMIQLYLEERRKADMSAAVNGSHVGNGNSLHNTPLWLVQAMLLNVIYGHNCGDKTAADIASTHCAALVSLARAAELAQPPPESTDQHGHSQNFRNYDEDSKLQDGQSPFGESAHHSQQSAAHVAWWSWKEAEERKRTLFAVFILSSLLVTAYNHTPAIMNSEILLDLPCEEDLWAADNAHEWLARGGSQAAESTALPFATALSTLLSANQRTPNMYGLNSFGQHGMNDGHVEPVIRPSTFGCLVLINALHNYIWETRSRHNGRQWTAQETDAMFSHIEPALNAWQNAWKANDHHRLQRPNAFGLGPLPADSIPLLDLAFVRLFVNLGRSKEAFWQRDFDAMADELARGDEIVQHAGMSPSSGSDRSSNHSSTNSPVTNNSTSGTRQGMRRPSEVLTTGQGSKRERHLRKAAFYAADSLTISSKFSLTYADATSHELPIQSAMCFFDCSQVLAEWASTVQERVGRYLGVLGRDDIDYTQVPAIMLLETEDVDLLNKIDNICAIMEEKMVMQANILARELGTLDPTAALGSVQNSMDRLPGLRDCGLGSKILRVTALMLEKAAVWPVTHVMANALETQATHMDQRADASITASS